MKIRLLVMLIAVFSFIPLFAESVFFKNGIILEGGIIDQEDSSKIVLRLDNKTKKTFLLKNVQRILYHRDYLTKRFITKKNGDEFEAYIVDESAKNYTFRKILESPDEFSIPKSDIVRISNQKIAARDEKEFEEKVNREVERRQQAAAALVKVETPVKPELTAAFVQSASVTPEKPAAPQEKASEFKIPENINQNKELLQIIPEVNNKVKERTETDVVLTAQNDEIYTIGALQFTMKDARVPKGGAVVPIALDDQGAAMIDRAFLIAETETTYELWKTVSDWAVANGYRFSNKGAMGGSGIIFITENGGSVKQPVTNINFRDMLVWCNALTEFCNAHKLTPNLLTCVYKYNGKIVKDSINENESENAFHNDKANGFRLPAEREWQYAARYRGSDKTNAVMLSGMYWTKGDSASGASVNADNSDETEQYANPGRTTLEVKSKKPNDLGLYDMSGNVQERCYGWYRIDLSVQYGGSGNLTKFYNNSFRVKIGERNLLQPSEYNYFVGFRLCRSK